jgi:CheY-like chemotaxis protein
MPAIIRGKAARDAGADLRPQGIGVIIVGRIGAYVRTEFVRDGLFDSRINSQLSSFAMLPRTMPSRDKCMNGLDENATTQHVLVVEDDMLIQMVVVDLLEDLGFAVDPTGSAREAMAKLTRLKGNLAAAVIDLGLPDRRGDVLVAEIRVVYPLLPIVLASGYGEEAFPAHLKQDEKIGFLAKPYTSEQLAGALASLRVITM